MKTINSVLAIWRFSSATYRERGLPGFGRRIGLWLRILPWLPWIRPLIEFLVRSHLEFVVEAEPSVLSKVRYPYLDRHWGVARRAAVITAHYDWLFRTFSRCQIRDIYSPAGLPIITIRTAQRQYLAVLEYHHSFRREGELMLTLRTQGGERLALMSLAVEDTGTGRTLLIGGLQGTRDQAEAVKQLTKDCHGLRIMALMVNMVRALAGIWGITEIRAISDEAHIFRHWLYRGKQGKQVMRSYDQLWSELDGQPDQEWYRIPLAMGYRCPQEVPANKRAMYVRRNQLLDEIRNEAGASLVEPRG